MEEMAVCVVDVVDYSEVLESLCVLRGSALFILWFWLWLGVWRFGWCQKWIRETNKKCVA